MSENTWQVPVGDNGQFGAYIYGSNNQPITTYAGTESLRVQVWKGDDMAAVAGVASVAWGTVAAGLTTVTILGSGTSALTPEWYLVRCEIQLSGAWWPYYDGWLELQDSPGSATAPTVYCTLQDMLDIGGAWLPRLMDENTRSSFLAERARARARLDQNILARCRPATGPWDRLLYGDPSASAELPDQYIKDLLDADALIVSAQVKEATAYLAIQLVCEKQLTWDDGDPFARRSAYYRAQWQRAMCSLVAEIDTDADGAGDIAVNLGRISIR